VLNQAPSALLFEVIDGGRCVFARAERFAAEFVIRALVSWTQSSLRNFGAAARLERCALGPKP
jgi:hypothetical protein